MPLGDEQDFAFGFFRVLLQRLNIFLRGGRIITVEISNARNGIRDWDKQRGCDDPRGYFSWGRLSGFSRSSSPVSIAVTGLTVDSGLSTFPTIQRRGYGLRDGGALRKDLG